MGNTLKIKELTDAAGLPPPEFENRTGEFIVRFSHYSKPLEKKTAAGGTMLGPCWDHVGTK